MAVKQNLDNDEIEPDVQDRIGNIHNDLPGQTGKESDPAKNGGIGYYNVALGLNPYNSEKKAKTFNQVEHKEA